MATRKQSRNRAVTNGDVRVLGRWPIINLITMESADFANAGAGRKGRSNGDTTTERVLRIHTDVPLADADIYERVRAALAAGKRKEAHKILKQSGMLKGETKRSKALIKAALLDTGN
jgi:hypothetical protein